MRSNYKFSLLIGGLLLFIALLFVNTGGASASLPAAGTSLTTYTLAVTTSGSGIVVSSPAGISCPLVCSADFVADTVITLHADSRPLGASYFYAWSGDFATFNDPLIFPMTWNLDVQANFVNYRLKNPVYLPLVVR